MARPVKMGLDYFPLDVVLDKDMELLEAEFGLKAFAIVVKLWMIIYQRGYYCEWDADVALLFARKNGVGYNVVSEIVNVALSRGIFDATMYERYGILTSHGIQLRYCEGKRGGLKRIDTDYLLLSAPEIADFAGKTEVITEKTPINTEISTQRKEKKRREEKRKEFNNSVSDHDSRRYDPKTIESFVNVDI